MLCRDKEYAMLLNKISPFAASAKWGSLLGSADSWKIHENEFFLQDEEGNLLSDPFVIIFTILDLWNTFETFDVHDNLILNVWI